MWFPLASLALAMLVVRRTVEKNLSSTVDSLALSWLQQGCALPFIFVTLFFARFYWPGELSTKSWLSTAPSLYSASGLYAYFNAPYDRCVARGGAVASRRFVIGSGGYPSTFMPRSGVCSQCNGYVLSETAASDRRACESIKRGK